MISYKREVESLVQFDHPHIVKVYDVFSSETEMFIILEYCSGGSLESIVKSGKKITPKALFQYSKEISDAIYYIHSNGYEHCDIKPSNILLDQFGRIKLADFGLCCPCDDTTTKKQYCGSLSFMSPESLVGKSCDPFKNDVWAFGVTLYYIIKRKLPFKGDNLPDLLRDIDLGYELPSTTPFQIREKVTKLFFESPP
ncbi:CAMK family protein kinase [Trichomonas vaginalis G3]|uniref:CAMK family protein kinase n=1 Tax=Trichomonas vaginalis (strain ATCC PRA-98 / G3) TaxID=412133 RepID=A2DKZ0_TRIV3|nr:CAMK family protein kinase [Trichomonas vaginalis G3]|eukprot:XP_001579929.1 CAMK family protein kinase [Trichomonas vaginalis G3]